MTAKSPSFALHFVVSAARDLCVKTRPSRNQSRVSEDTQTLKEIGHSAAELIPKVERLSGVARSVLEKALSDSAFAKRCDGMLATEIYLLLSDLRTAAPAAAAALSEKFGKDRGGPNLSTHRRAFGNPYAYFITRLVDLYVDVHGLENLTATIASRRGSSCYEFINAVHQYALGDSIGYEKLFKQLVRKRKAKKDPERPFYPIH